MPPASDPNRTTRLLAVLLALSLLLLLSLVALTEHNKIMTRLRADQRGLNARRDAHLLILADEDRALARDNWIREHQPPLADAASASSALLDFVKQTAAESGVTLSATKLLEPAQGLAGTEIGIEIQAATRFENAVRLLHSLQAPDKFISAAKFSIKSDAEPPNVVLDLRLVRHYAPARSPE